MLEGFEFSKDTGFESHKGTAPKRKEPPGDDAPLPVPATTPPEVSRKRGRVRTGKYPFRKPPDQAKKQRPHGWALSDAWKPLYVEGWARYGNPTDAADFAGVSPATGRARRQQDPAFDAECADAYQRFKDNLEREVLHRAIVGREKKVVTKSGEVKSLGPEPSDLMLIFAAKRHIPDFKDNYKPPENSASQANSQVIVNFLAHHDEANPSGVIVPFDQFSKRPDAALPAPAETDEQKRERLLAELAALDARTAEATPDAQP